MHHLDRSLMVSRNNKEASPQKSPNINTGELMKTPSVIRLLGKLPIRDYYFQTGVYSEGLNEN